MFTDLFANVLLGLETAATPTNLLYCFIGVFLGMAIGVLPGIGALAAISMLFPITFHLDATAALIMLAGIFYGTSYGGSTTSIMLNVPGTPSGAVACLDGYPMAKQGRGGIALLLTTVGSFVGGSVGIIIMMLFSQMIANVALNFGPAEYFSLMLVGLIAASTIASGSAIKGLAMVALGILLGLVGSDIYTGESRFTFGFQQLYEGISLVVVAMGLFGLAEVISSIRTVRGGIVVNKRVTLRSMIPTRSDMQRSWKPMLRGTGIGAFLGILPGVGALIASFMAYSVEKRLSRHPEEFGHGAVEGIVASETANNAADQTAFIPTLTLGIPGSPTMAIILGVLLIHGIAPGPTLLANRPEMFWGLVMSFWIGNILLVILNIPLIGVWIRLLTVPYKILYPTILMFICIGVYSVHNSPFDIWLVILFGGVGYLFRLFEFSPAPLVLGFVLGPMMEENFRRALLISRGNFMTFIERPISGVLIAFSLALLVLGLWLALRRKTLITPGLEE